MKEMRQEENEKVEEREEGNGKNEKQRGRGEEGVCIEDVEDDRKDCTATN